MNWAIESQKDYLERQRRDAMERQQASESQAIELLFAIWDEREKAKQWQPVNTDGRG